MTNISTEPQTPVILYDGVCHLCDGCVQFVLRHEKAPEIRFCHLQSETAEKLLGPFGQDIKLNTIYFIENNTLYDRSSAVLKVVNYLSWPWSWMRVLSLFPKRFRDAVYNYVGKNRYRWFGQSQQCILPGIADASRFLQ